MHAQFEIIHPFVDGNGRVGRILLPLFLYEKKLLRSPMFYLSSYLEAHREEYYAKLLGVSQDKDWESWIEFFLQAVIEQAKLNCLKAAEILALYNRIKIKVSELTGSKYSIHTTDAIFHQPYFNSTKFAQIYGIPKSTALRILRVLSENDILDKVWARQGSRPALYSFPELLGVVNA